MRVSRSWYSINKAMEELEIRSKVVFAYLRFAELIFGLPTFGWDILPFVSTPPVVNVNLRKDVFTSVMTLLSNLQPESTTPVENLEFLISPQSFEKFRTGAFEIISGIGEDDS